MEKPREFNVHIHDTFSIQMVALASIRPTSARAMANRPNQPPFHLIDLVVRDVIRIKMIMVRMLMIAVLILVKMVRDNIRMVVSVRSMVRGMVQARIQIGMVMISMVDVIRMTIGLDHMGTLVVGVRPIPSPSVQLTANLMIVHMAVLARVLILPAAANMNDTRDPNRVMVNRERHANTPMKNIRNAVRLANQRAPTHSQSVTINALLVAIVNQAMFDRRTIIAWRSDRARPSSPSMVMIDLAMPTKSTMIAPLAKHRALIQNQNATRPNVAGDARVVRAIFGPRTIVVFPNISANSTKSTSATGSAKKTARITVVTMAMDTNAIRLRRARRNVLVPTNDTVGAARGANRRVSIRDSIARGDDDDAFLDASAWMDIIDLILASAFQQINAMSYQHQ